MPVSFTSHFILFPGPFITSHHHKRKSLYSTLRYFKKEHIYLIRITGYHHYLSISLLVLVVPYLLCLTHKLNFIIGRQFQEKTQDVQSSVLPVVPAIPYGEGGLLITGIQIQQRCRIFSSGCLVLLVYPHSFSSHLCTFLDPCQ